MIYSTMKTIKEMKSEALTSLDGNWGKVVLCSLVYLIPSIRSSYWILLR